MKTRDTMQNWLKTRVKPDPSAPFTRRRAVLRALISLRADTQKVMVAATLCAIIASVIPATAVHAEGNWTPVRPAGAFAESWNVGSMEEFAPFNYTVDGRYSGIDVKILDEAAASIGVELVHKPLPWNRVMLDFQMGNLEALFQLAPTPERFEKWYMVGPLRRTRTVFMTRQDSPVNDVRRLRDLDDLVVGVVGGFTYEDRFDANADIHREESKDDFTNVRKLLLGRSDVIVGGYATLSHIANELNATDKLRFLPTPLTEQARYIAFPRDALGDYQARRLQKALDKMHTTGRIQEIVQRHLVQ
ncbi:ABC transporter substrate-binding protein [Thalassobius sp. Cn5-15]|uniref:substrate-binding periplasmic protein n=1 Tax=Thalassobius sp. Cn5-15 TaxID=2917763 RepID=UPI001EF25375|nr:transporter substrate-binding domain-containing protein [Thalassobius sp. Cn5-15]MCG7492371.1 transporter substrate-binding domain-containing protein [Thalassobius sp. Cn5-15]